MKSTYTVNLLVLCLCAGFMFHAGFTAADLLLPDPPREPIKLTLDVDEAEYEDDAEPGAEQDQARPQL